MSLTHLVLLYLMAVVYIAAGINHFWHPAVYLRIMPPYLPAPMFLNSAAGIAEILFGLLLLWPATRSIAAWGIIILLLLFFTVHIYMLQQSYAQPRYIVTPLFAWARLLLQPLIILWAYQYT